MININFTWSCPSGCSAARVIIGKLVREHLVGTFTTVFHIANKGYFLHHAGKELDEVLEALDKVGKSFTKQRLFGSASWIESKTRQARSYHKGEIHVDKCHGSGRVDPGTEGKQEAPTQEQISLDKESDAGTVDGSSGDQ